MRLKDNQQKISRLEFEDQYPNISQQLLDRTLENLSKEDGIFIFPNDLLDSPDLDKGSKVLETVNQKIKTGNVIGFLGCGQKRLTISSRFSDDMNDYFLHYMLQKVLHLNLTSLDVGLSHEERLYQLLIYLFPKYLQAALRKGLYKEYQRFSYNDSHVKGALDVASHLKKNIPFTGKIAYSTREFSFDNALMQLIRHCIAFLQNNSSGQRILSASTSIKENVQAILRVTSFYELSDRAKIIRLNESRPIRHAYYREYGKLQQLCLMILKRGKHGLGTRNQKIHGLLFDVAWLWEEYVASLLGENFKHSLNKQRQGGYSLFNNGNGKIYPDFLSLSESSIVGDAKYKPSKNIKDKDYLQILAYMYRFNSRLGLFFFPKDKDSDNVELNLLQGKGERREVDVSVRKIGIDIPQKSHDYPHFVNQIQQAEEAFQAKMENF